MKMQANSAFYYEVCMLRTLARMGYLDSNELNGVIQIAVKDYGTNLLMEKYCV